MIRNPAWYKQFWPWFIIALPATAVVAGLLTLFIAIKHSDSLVEDDYYKEGLAINTNLQKEKRAKDLGISIKFDIDSSSKRINLELVSKTKLALPSLLNLKLIHPMDAKRDKTFPLQRDEKTGTYSQQYSELADIDWMLEVTPIYLENKPDLKDDWKLRGKRSLYTRNGT